MTPEAFLQSVKTRLEPQSPFAQIAIRSETGENAGPARLVCTARDAAAPASYRIELVDGKLWVSLVTPDRWLSQSIEQDLVHTGDKLEDLLDEELVDLQPGFPRATVKRAAFEHFRSEDLLFTFRSPLPADGSNLDESAVDTAALWILAYEATFRRLGDMEPGEDDE